MNPFLKENDIVTAKRVRAFTSYNEGNIILFKNEDGIKVVHMILGLKNVDGKTCYVTQGLNPDTNPDIDVNYVSKENIIGKVILSKTDLVRLLILVEQGKILYVNAHGMVKIKEDLTTRQDMHQKLIEYIKNYPGPHSKSYKSFLVRLTNEFKEGKSGKFKTMLNQYMKQQPLHPNFNENDVIKMAKRRVMVDKNGRIETLYTPLEIGNDEFGLIHILLGHWKNQFQRWQMDVFDLVDTIMNTINTKIGRLNADGVIIYEMGFSDIYGKEQYLTVVFGDYNNIITAWRISDYEDADMLFTTTNFIGEV